MHPNQALARREIELIEAGDFDALQELYADDLIVHYPGRNPLSGTSHVDDFLARFEACSETEPSPESSTMHWAPMTTPSSFSASVPPQVVSHIRGTPSRCYMSETGSSPNAGYTSTINTHSTSS